MSQAGKSSESFMSRLTRIGNHLSFARFITEIRPSAPFGNLPIPSPPDYDNPDHWAAYPGKPGKTEMVPEGTESVSDDRPADCFFIHPTSYFGSASWNAPLDNASSREIVEELILPGQAAVFNSRCRFYIPRYRQATFYVFLREKESGRRALELAYRDVANAFEHFLKVREPGRPFILASHSQGSLHAMRLLQEKLDGTEASRDMIAAYVVGFRLPTDFFGKQLKKLEASEQHDDLGRVIAWDTYVEGGTPMHFLDRAEVPYLMGDRVKWVRRARKKPLGINPVTWRHDTHEAPAALHLGGSHVVTSTPIKPDAAALFGDAPLGLDTTHLSPVFESHVTSRLASDGFLYVSRPANNHFRRFLLPGGNYHNYDYALFFMDIRRNVEDRVDRWMREKA